MNLIPEDAAELGRHLAMARPAAGAVSDWDLSRLDRVLEYQPEDLTITIEAGMTLGHLQRILGVHCQWLPLDPPGTDALTIERLLALDLTGPRRLGRGTARDWLLGLRAVQGDGRLIHSGGRVVKNVAGIDVMKLFVGGAAALGIIVEATFKVAPVPESEVFLCRRCRDFNELDSLTEAVAGTRLTPVAFDAYQQDRDEAPTTVIGFAGCREEVAYQIEAAQTLGWRDPANLSHEAILRPGLPESLSTLPSELVRRLSELATPRFIARLGNGIAHVPVGMGASRSVDPGVRLLEARLKSSFDPAGILPGLPA